MTLETLPALNATLNSVAFVLLMAGRVAIAKRNETLHRNLMISCVSVSAAFLVSYLYYHANVGHTTFPELGVIKTIYLCILVPHIILAAVMVPLILMTLLRAFQNQRQKHLFWARITFPIWVYVSITGVVIYFMVYQWFPGAT